MSGPLRPPCWRVLFELGIVLQWRPIGQAAPDCDDHALSLRLAIRSFPNSTSGATQHGIITVTPTPSVLRVPNQHGHVDLHRHAFHGFNIHVH
jgi:hypothetical protein